MRIVLLIILLQAVCSCSMYKSEFDCPAKKGMGCLSVSHVFDAVDDGTLDEHLAQENKEDQPQKCEQCKAANIQRGSQQGESQKTTIWFKEYKDAKGKIHKEHEVQL